MRPFLRRLKHKQLHSSYSKIPVNALPCFNDCVHTEKQTGLSMIWKDPEKEMQAHSFLKYLSTVSAMTKMDSPDTLFTGVLGMPQSQKEAHCR